MGNGIDKVKIMMVKRKTRTEVRTRRQQSTFSLIIFKAEALIISSQEKRLNVILISSQLKTLRCPNPSHRPLNAC